jgi:hypothetical protein
MQSALSVPRLSKSTYISYRLLLLLSLPTSTLIMIFFLRLRPIKIPFTPFPWFFLVPFLDQATEDPANRVRCGGHDGICVCTCYISIRGS